MDAELTKTLDAIQQTLAALASRVAVLEASLGHARAGTPTSTPEAPAAVPEQAAPELVGDAAPLQAASPSGQADVASSHRADDEIAPEILLAIAAAVAAFLGERAHVRQIRLISSPAWGQQGRVNVQASHALHR